MLTCKSGEVAVVTGAGSGIGRALARCFHAEGMHVMLADRDVEAIDATRKGMDGPGKVMVVATDVTREGDLDSLARCTVEEFGRVDLVCNNAGVQVEGLSWDLPLEVWRWILDVNVMGVVHGIRSFVPYLRAQGAGHVVNTASMAGFVAGPRYGPYIASKAAVTMLSEVLWHELQADGGHVGVSVLCPGAVATRLHDNARSRPADVHAAVESLHDPPDPGGPGVSVERMDPADVAALVLGAVRDDRFYVFTESRSLALAKARLLAVLNGADPVGWGS